jgi:hypothetical protein
MEDAFERILSEGEEMESMAWMDDLINGMK